MDIECSSIFFILLICVNLHFASVDKMISMSQKSYIKCLDCGTLNLNSDYCFDCGSIININLKRQLERAKKMEKEIELEQATEPNKVTKFLQHATEHPNTIVRGFSNFIYAIWIFMGMIVGAIIAGFISIVTG